MALSDLNGDGFKDIAIAEDSGSIVLLLGNGNGSFKYGSPLGTGESNVRDLKVADFNNDGRLDLASGSWGSATLSVFLGNGNGSFQAQRTFEAQTLGNISTLVTGDFNLDGATDIATSVYDSPGTISILLGNGNGTFQSRLTKSETGIGTLLAGDFTGDGRMDLVGADYDDNIIKLYTANGGYATTSASLNLSTQQGAREALTTVRATFDRIEAQLGSIGATTSRLLVEVQALRSNVENSLAAAGRITDADIAEESSRLVSTQILQKVTSAVLLQANQVPALALQLLSG